MAGFKHFVAANVVEEIRRAVQEQRTPDFSEVKCNILISLSMVLPEFLDKYEMPVILPKNS